MKDERSTRPTRGSTGDEPRPWMHAFEEALALPEPAEHHGRPGVEPRAERALSIVGGVLLLVFAAGWTWSISRARMSGDEVADEYVAASGVTQATAAVTSALTNTNAPTTAYLTDAALNAFTDR